MHFPGERCPFLPGPKFITETLPAGPKFLTETLPQHLEAFANTCHPLSVTKSPAPRWQSCPQALSPPGATRVSLLPCAPLVQKCLVLCPEPCDTTRLLPRTRVAAVPQALGTFESPRGDKKRVARSLPPCAPRCPEPGKLRFPPCAVRSSASCRGECRSHKVAKCPQRCPEVTSGYSAPLRGVTECPPRCLEVTSGYSAPLRGVTECPQRCPEMISGYSAPLRGVTECPPQPALGHSFLQELLAQHRCSRGYPTQECVTCWSSEQRLSSATRAEGTRECRPRKEVVTAKVAQDGGTKARSVAQSPSKARCAHPRASPRPSRLPAAGAKRSGHAKKSRCASKWLW